MSKDRKDERAALERMVSHPDVVLPNLPASLLDKKLREYFEDIGEEWPGLKPVEPVEKVKKRVQSESVTTEFLSQSSPSITQSENEIEGKRKSDRKSKRITPSQSSSIDSSIVVQSQPSPDSTSSKLIDYKIQYQLKEFSVVCNQLSDDLINLATNGQLDWKTFFKNGTIVSKPSRSHNRSIHEATPFSTNRKKSKKYQNEDYKSDHDTDVTSSSHEGSSEDADYSDSEEGRRKKKWAKYHSLPKKRRRRPDSDEEQVGPLPSFKCTICSVTLRAQKSLDRHMAAHKPIGDPIQCPVCPIISSNPADHEIHTYEVHEGPNTLEKSHKIHCKKCTGQTFTEYADFDSHIIAHVEPKDIGYGCTICGFGSEKYATVQTHLKSHILFKCTFCDNTYNKLRAVENHCTITHRRFGRPFSCSLCDYRTAVYGLLVEHKESRHAIKKVSNREGEKCLLCGDSNFWFTSREVTLDHLAQHVKIHLYKCIACDYTGETQQVFDDHFIETHISLMIEHTIYCEETNIDKIMDNIAVLVKKNVSNERSRNRPNFLETEDAVRAILDDSANENSSFGDPSDRGYDFSSLEAEYRKGTDRKKNKKRKTSEVTFEDSIPLDTSFGRPKRRSFINAQVKLAKSKIDEDEEKSKDAKSGNGKSPKQIAPDYRYGIPIETSTEASSALETLSFDQVASFIPEEISTPSMNAAINENLCAAYQMTIGQSCATVDDDDEDNPDENMEEVPMERFNSLGQVVDTIQPGVNKMSKSIKVNSMPTEQNTQNCSYDQNSLVYAINTSLTPFGPSGSTSTVDTQQVQPQEATYYVADTKTLVINGVPVYDSEGNVAQVEPEEVDQVYQMYASQIGLVPMMAPGTNATYVDQSGYY